MILARALEAAVTRRSLAIPRAAFRSHLNGALVRPRGSEPEMGVLRLPAVCARRAPQVISYRTRLSLRGPIRPKWQPA
jgi:hypothetical protein